MTRGRKAGKAPARAAQGTSKSTASKPKRPLAAAKRASARPVAGRGRPPAARAARTAAAMSVDPALFDALTEGERADALRVLTEDRRLANMAKVARYRVVAVEPLVVKPPHPLFGRRLARVAAYDYAADRGVDGVVDLDAGTVVHLQVTQSQPALGRDEEAAAVTIAMRDERVKRELGLGDEPQAAMHYWSKRDTDLAYSRRSAAVLFGPPGSRPSLVAVVDLVDSQVTEVVPAEQW